MDHISFHPGVYVPRHAIYLVPDHNPKLFRIAEVSAFLAWLEPQKYGLKQVSDRIIRIRKDSIFLLSSKYRLSDFYKVYLSSFRNYLASDSSKWEIIFPPDSVYKSRSEFRDFLYALEKRVKKEHRDWMAAPFYHNILKLNFSLLANLELAISYEHRFDRTFAIDMEAGYQFQGVPGDAGDPMNVYPLWKQHGISAVTGMKYYFNKQGYIEPVMIYKYLTMIQANSKWPNAGYIILQDAFANHYGMALRVGTLTRLWGMIVDGYFGLGVKVVMTYQLAYGEYPIEDSNEFFWYNTDHSPVVNDLVQWWPVVNLGIKLGFGF
jgi:hypothetical protein